MERRKFLHGAGMAGILAAGTAPAIVHAQQQIRWRLASSFPKSLEAVFGASEAFSKYVSDATGGKFVISVHPGGELVPPVGVVDAVQQGTIECAHTAPYYFFGKDETFAFDCTIPFGMTSRAMTAWMYEGNGLKLLREFYAQYNIVNFPCGNTGAQMGGWYRKEIKSVKDFEGLKFRVGGFGGRVLAKLGAVPQNIPAGEIYQALEKGTIDAVEWVGPYDDQKLGFNKVAKFYSYPGCWEGGPQISLYVNQKQWASLPKEDQTILEDACMYAHAEMQARYDAKNPLALKQLVAAGAQLRPFPKEVMEVCYKAAMELYAEISAKNPDFKKIYDDMRNFQRDQILWNRFPEYPFNQYVNSVKI